jgi:hypothetical protein
VYKFCLTRVSCESCDLFSLFVKAYAFKYALVFAVNIYKKNRATPACLANYISFGNKIYSIEHSVGSKFSGS